MSTMRCKCRRQAETSLRCARCSVPICPDCSRVAPAGMLCRECGSGKHSPLFQVSASSLALGYAASLGAGALGGWLLAGIGWSLGYFGGLLAFMYGIGIGEVGLRVTGRKRGLHMEIMAGVCSVLGLLAGIGLYSLTSSVLPRAGHISLLYLYLLNPMSYVMFAIAVYGAVMRIRNL